MEEQSKKPTYKYCIVPNCKNTIRNAPDKVFFHVPRGADIRKKWCKIMKRDMVSPSTCLYCCEDHFDIEGDTDNYMEYKIMFLQEKRNCTLRLKKGVVPHKFNCKKDTKSDSASVRKGVLKRKPLEAIEEVPTAPPAKQSVSACPVQAEIKVCRGCLALDVKMYDMKDFELSEMFQNVTGISVSDNTEITHHRVCWECAARLTAAATFRDKALLSDALLKNIAHMKKNDIATLKQNYSVLKSRLTVFSAHTLSDIKCEQAYKEIDSNDEAVTKEIKTEITDQDEIEFEEHEPWVNVPVKIEVGSDPIAENNITGDPFIKLTHLNRDSYSKDDTANDTTNTVTLEYNTSTLTSRLTDPSAFTSSEIKFKQTISEHRDKETTSNNKTVLKETTIKQEREETDFDENEPWEDISVKIEIESDPAMENNTKSDVLIKENHLNNDSTSKEYSGSALRTIELQNDFEEDNKMSYDTVINDDSNTNVNTVVLDDTGKIPRLNIISILEDEISSEEDSQCLAEFVSVKNARNRDKL